MGEEEPLIFEAAVKLWGEKKWKDRYIILEQVNEQSAKILVFKNHKTRRKPQNSKKVYKLEGFFGVESGFNLQNEYRTLALFSQTSDVVILAFDSRDVYVQFQSAIQDIFGDSCQFKVKVISCPDESDLVSQLNNNVRLHIYDGRFCICANNPPVIVSFWNFCQLRRYGPIHNKFGFEAGQRAGRNRSGMHMFLSSQSDQIHSVFIKAAKKELRASRKNSRNGSTKDRKFSIGMQMPGPDRGMVANNGGKINGDAVCRHLESIRTSDRSSGFERRPLLDSTSSAQSQPTYMYSTSCESSPHAYANEVFEMNSSEPTPLSPQPFLFPAHTPDFQSKLDNISKNDENADPCMSHNYVNGTPVRIPMAQRATCLLHKSDCKNCQPQPTQIWIPSPALVVERQRPSMPLSRPGPPLAERMPQRNSVCNVCTEHRNYQNQRFIDSLQHYYNFDAIFYPCSPAVLRTVDQSPSGYMSMQPAHTGYIPFEPAEAPPTEAPPPPDKEERTETPPPADPVPCQKEKISPEEISQLVKTHLPPYTPKLTYGKTVNMKKRENGEKGQIRRTISTCLPDESRVVIPDRQGTVTTWSEGGTGGRRRSRSLFSLGNKSKLTPVRTSPDLATTSLQRGTLLRESSRKAKRLFGTFLKLKNERDREIRVHSEPPALDGLDLDEPVYGAAGHSMSELPSTSQTPDIRIDGQHCISPIWERRRRKQGVVFPPIDELSHRLGAVKTGKLEPILDTSASSDQGGTTEESQTTTDSSVGPSRRRLSKRISNDSNSNSLKPYKGVAKSTTVSRSVTPVQSRHLKDEFRRPVSGCYSIYDGDPVSHRNVSSILSPSDEIGRALFRMAQHQTKILGLPQAPAPPQERNSDPNLTKQEGPTVFKFPTRDETMRDDPRLNYCDVNVGGGGTDPLPTPRTLAGEQGSVYATIDGLATKAAAQATQQRNTDQKNRSNSIQAIQRKESGVGFARRWLSKRRPISRGSSMNSLTHV